MRPETACTRERKGKLCCSFSVVGRWLIYIKADHDYQPFLRPCEKECERRKREQIGKEDDDARPVILEIKS
jgi:hypothetical protein